MLISLIAYSNSGLRNGSLTFSLRLFICCCTSSFWSWNLISNFSTLFIPEVLLIIILSLITWSSFIPSTSVSSSLHLHWHVGPLEPSEQSILELFEHFVPFTFSVNIIEQAIRFSFLASFLFKLQIFLLFLQEMEMFPSVNTFLPPPGWSHSPTSFKFSFINLLRDE